MRPPRARPLVGSPEIKPLPGMGHNGGPPLDHVPEWGTGGIGNYFIWKAASDKAFSQVV